jgi:PEP-CTERM motif
VDLALRLLTMKERGGSVTKALRILALCAVAFLSGAMLVPNAAADSVSFSVADPNIIGFNNATACGGSVLCNGGQAYLLSQIGSWFSTPTSSQQYLVVNDLGVNVTTLNLTMTGVFQATNGPWENFQCEVGAPHYFGGCSFSGPGFVTYTQGPNSTSAAANFNSFPVTFTWSGGSGIPVGAKFDLTTASWVSNVGSTPVPEPSTFTLLGGGFFGLLAFAGLRRR